MPAALSRPLKHVTLELDPTQCSNTMLGARNGVACNNMARAVALPKRSANATSVACTSRSPQLYIRMYMLDAMHQHTAYKHKPARTTTSQINYWVGAACHHLPVHMPVVTAATIAHTRPSSDRTSGCWCWLPTEVRCWQPLGRPLCMPRDLHECRMHSNAF